LKWLDDERRKDKIAIDALEQRLAMLEGNIPGLMEQIRELSGDLAKVSSGLSRFDHLEAEQVQMRVEYTRSIDAIEKQRAEYSREMERVRYSDLESLNKGIADVRKGLEPIPELKRNNQARVEEDFRLGRLIEEVEAKVTETRRSDEEYKRGQKLLEETQRQDSKRLTDIQGELAAIRKRQDEQRGRVDLILDSSRKLEVRVNEIQAAESERRQAQVSFMDKVNMGQMEKDRIWKEWQSRFEIIEKQAMGIDVQLQSLEATHRAVKRSEQAFNDITERFERRINEITEMQRLTEDRFRQEWVAFRADDQKRWTNYSLVQEENQRELSRQLEKYHERMVLLEEAREEIQQLVKEIVEENRQRLQSLLVMARDFMETYDRTFGRSGT
jgi:chromosome segregation ATPase